MKMVVKIMPRRAISYLSITVIIYIYLYFSKP